MAGPWTLRLFLLAGAFRIHAQVQQWRACKWRCASRSAETANWNHGGPCESAARAADDALRAPEADSFQVAASYNFLYYVAQNDRIVGRLWRERGTIAWQSQPVPGLSQTLPVLSVDTTPGSTSDALYFLNVKDGRLYSFSGGNKTAPRWRSNFKCSTQPGQQHQVITVRRNPNLLVARCGSSLAVVRASDGTFVTWIPCQQVDPIQPVPFPTNTTLATWSGNQLFIWAVQGPAAGTTQHILTLKETTWATSSIAAGPHTLVLTGKGSPTIKLVSSVGKQLASYTCKMPSGYTGVRVLPRPTIVGTRVYLVLVAKDAKGNAVWSLLALDITSPSKPVLLFGPGTPSLAFPQPGTPPPQPLAYNRNYLFVTLPASRRFNAYNLTTGAFEWGNMFSLPWPSTYTRPGLITAPYCCDMMWISNMRTTSPPSGPTTSTIVTILLTIKGQPPVLPSQCYCTPK